MLKVVSYNPILFDFESGHRKNLESAGESHEVGANTETGASASRARHGRDKDVENAKCGGGSQRDDDDLFDLEALLGDGVGGNGHHETLDNVLDGAFDEFGKIKDVAHGYKVYSTRGKKIPFWDWD